MDTELIRRPADITLVNEGKGVVVGHADSFSPTVNVILSESGGKRTELSSEYFNLLIGYEPFESDHFLVTKDRALKEYMSDDAKDRFYGWTPEKIAEIKKLPAVISQERDGTDEQQAVFAFIRDIHIQDNGIMVYFQRYYPIPFSFLSENLLELAMDRFELTRTHWTIKKVNLLQVFQDAGINVFGR